MTKPETMRAMVLEQPGQPLKWLEVPAPRPGPEQVLLRVHTCGVCRTDLHVVDGELPHPKLPLILGHEIVGTVVATGSAVRQFRVGERLGVPWLGHTCGTCRYCRKGRENLCDNPGFTGYTLDGGYAEYAVADQRYSFPLPPAYGDAEAAPLLCAGLIGYRSYRMARDAGERLGIYGFGAAAHITVQIAVYQGKKVYAFTRPGDTETQEFARRLGAVWAGSSAERPPEELDAAIIFAPVGAAHPRGPEGLGQRRGRGQRRHPHERHPVVSLRPSLGGAGGPLGGQPDPGRRRGVSGARPPGAGQNRGADLSPQAGQRGPGAAAPGPDPGGGGAGGELE